MFIAIFTVPKPAFVVLNRFVALASFVAPIIRVDNLFNTSKDNEYSTLVIL